MEPPAIAECLGPVLIKLHCRSGAEMSAFGSKADMEWCCDESPLLTQSRRDGV